MRASCLSLRGQRVNRRCVSVLLVLAMTLSLLRPAVADGVAETAYGNVAGWLFEQYLQQSISAMTYNVTQVSPEAGKRIEAEAPSMQRFLSRHRAAFVATLVPILKVHLPSDGPSSVNTPVTVAAPSKQ